MTGPASNSPFPITIDNDENALYAYDRRELRRALAVIGSHYDPGPMGLGQRFHDLSSEAGGGRP